MLAFAPARTQTRLRTLYVRITLLHGYVPLRPYQYSCLKSFSSEFMYHLIIQCELNIDPCTRAHTYISIASVNYGSWYVHRLPFTVYIRFMA